MKYYEMHDEVYKNLKSKGCVSWDGKKEVAQLFEHEINQALAKFYPLQVNQAPLRVLDLGTGTGTAALYLAQFGHQVTGVDASATAIDMAQENARQLNLKVDFLVRDINQLSAESFEDPFDLIIDSSFLHCIVELSERAKVLELVHAALRVGGEFFVHTMVASEDMSEFLRPEHIELEQEILWSTGKMTWPMQWQERNGKKVFPHRRIRMLKNLEEEFLQAGFEVKQKEIRQLPGLPSTYIGSLLNRF